MTRIFKLRNDLEVDQYYHGMKVNPAMVKPELFDIMLHLYIKEDAYVDGLGIQHFYYRFKENQEWWYVDDMLNIYDDLPLNNKDRKAKYKLLT